MLRIYADFNNTGEDDRVRLNTVGSLRDLRALEGQLADGLRVILYMTDEFEVEGTLVFDTIWNGIPDWSTIKYADDPG